MTAVVTLTSQFQISIPKSAREPKRWKAGQKFVFIPKGKGVLVMPVS
ncbi:MAG: AbrB/MazE/SpoVT family DNA-binding domain-containing protein [Methylococcales bacterium]